MNKMFESIDALFDSGKDLTVNVEKQHEDRIKALKESVEKKRAAKLLEQENKSKRKNQLKEAISKRLKENEPIVMSPEQNTQPDQEQQLTEYADGRRMTNDVIAAVEDGFLSWETVAKECLSYMSEDDVKDMVSITDWGLASDEELEVEGYFDESQKLEGKEK